MGDAQIVEAVLQILQGMADHQSKKQGSLYLLSDHGASKVLDHGDSRMHRPERISIEEDEKGDVAGKIFAIKEKEDPRTVLLWMNSILPALHDILAERLGADYAASLVRRGPTNIEAVPCIHIESSYIPEEKTRMNIEQALDEICSNNKHEAIPVRFLTGNFRMLFGEQGAMTVPDYKKEIEQQRLKYQFNRPSRTPGMGASLGMLCSEKVSATLGGHIMVEGQKFILTSEHFIAKCIENAVTDDQETIVSSSPVNLIEIKGSLRQSLRNKRDKINSFVKAAFGDRGLLPSEMNDCPRLQEAYYDISATLEKLQQVDKPIADFVLGTRFRRSNDGLREALGIRPPGSNYPNSRLMHHMDWAVCKVNSRAGENRHRYQSNRDALASIDRSDCIEGLEDICHETCEISPGAQVYYVGQRSGHRGGTVNGVPMEVCIKDVKSREWSIVDSQGSFVSQSSIEGDSGAWVIQKNGSDKRLMGQILGHSTGQILFTPIKDLFADITEQLYTDVTLPPVPHVPGGAGRPAIANFSCSVREVPDTKAYGWMIHKRPERSTTSIPTYLDLIRALNEIEQSRAPGLDTPQRPRSPVPSLTASPSSPKIMPQSPATPPPCRSVGTLDKEQIGEECHSESCEPRVEMIEDVDSDRRIFSEPDDMAGCDVEVFGNQAEKMSRTRSGLAFKSSFHVDLPARSPTWPSTGDKQGSRAVSCILRTRSAHGKPRIQCGLRLNIEALADADLRTGEFILLGARFSKL